MKRDPNIIHELPLLLPLTWQHLANEKFFQKKDKLERYNKHQQKLCLSATKYTIYRYKKRLNTHVKVVLNFQERIHF